MASLDDFSIKTGVSLEELSPEKEQVVVSNEASAKNLASYTAISSDNPEEVEKIYRQSVSEIEQTGSSVAADRILQMAKEKSFSRAREAFTDFLADPEVSDGAKQRLASDYLDVQNERFNIRNIVSEESLISDSGSETVEQENVRVSLADAIEEINEYKREAQALLNQEAAQANKGVTDSYFDIVEYIMPYVESKFVGETLNEYRGGDSSAFIKSAFLLGNAKEELVEGLRKMPPEERLAATSSLIDVINKHDSIVMPDDNEFAKVDLLRTIVEDGYYEDTDKWIDNVISVLDMTLLGGVVGRGIKALSGAAGLTEASQRMLKRRSVRTQTQPTTVSQNYKDTNPEKAKAMHDAVLNDETGEIAEAAYGTSRTESIADDILPEIDDDIVLNKVSNPEQKSNMRNTPNADIMDSVKRDGSIYYIEQEKRAARAKVVNDFFNATNLMPRKEMSRVGAVSDGAVIKAVYGPSQGGWSSAEDAIEQVKYALRNQGVTGDNITLLRREGAEYVPTSLKELDALEKITEVVRSRSKQPRNVRITKDSNKNFLVQVDHRYKFNPLDVSKWTDLSVSRLNVFDKSTFFSGNSQGSITRHLFDAQSLLDPAITLGANVAVDKASALEKQLLDLGSEFSDVYSKLPKNRQEMMESLIKEANFKGQGFDYNRLVADGYKAEEIEALKAWREAWDTMYWLENTDLAKTLRAQNYHVLEGVEDTRLFAKPISRNQTGRFSRVYDPVSGKIVDLNNEQLTQLYKEGGSIAKMKRPLLIEEEGVENILVTGKPGSTYLRRINDNDQVLNYREGYYTVQYDAPKYIVKKVKDKNDNVIYEKAVAVAGNTKDAELTRRRLASTDGGEYFVRGDVRRTRMDSEEYWDIQQASGRTAQKVRGERLEEGTDPMNAGADNQFVLGPADSLVNAARSTANRVSMRDYIEATKARFLNQYGEVLPQKFGEPQFPNKAEEIGLAGREGERLATDARTTWEYINYLENGYINGIDESYKAIMNVMANAVGKVSKKGEEVLHAASDTRGPASFGKNAAFQLYLALNPLRQILVQSHQAVQLTVNFPKYVISQRLAADMTLMGAKRLGIEPTELMLKSAGRTRKEVDQMFKEYERSGLAASIDKQNLVRGSLSEMTDMAGYRGKSNLFTKTLSGSRKVGFDLGEEVNIMSAWLAHRDAASTAKGGKKLTQSELDTVTGKARNYTYNMNAAGDMPYNQNALSLLFQFFQVPHKAMLQVTTNKVLTKAEKVRLAGFSAAMYTLPPAAMYSIFGDILPDDPETREAVVHGLEGLVFNKMISLLTGEESNIDFSSLAPADMYGTYEFIHSLFTTDLGTMIASSPSGQLFFGNNPRITNFAKTAARYFNVIDDYEEPTEFSDVANSFASLASGYSNTMKALYAYEYGKKVNSYGGITDPQVSKPEAIAQALGLGTMDEAKTYYLRNKLYKDSKSFEKDVVAWYRDLKKAVGGDLTPQEAEFQSRVLSEAWRVFGKNDSEARRIISQQLRRDVRKGDATLYKSVLRTTGWQDSSEVRSMIKALPNISEEERQQMLDTIDFVDQYKDER